jgi:hypothetical protein
MIRADFHRKDAKKRKGTEKMQFGHGNDFAFP